MRQFIQFAVGFALLTVSAAAQDTYKLPPPEVVALADAPVPPSVVTSRDHRWLLLIGRDPMPTIADISRRMLRLGGIRIDPGANAQFRVQFETSLSLRAIDGKDSVAIPLPKGARLSGARWSHTSKHFAFTVVTAAGTELWAASTDKPTQPIKVTDRLSAVETGGYVWMPDGLNLLCTLVPEGRGVEPKMPEVPTGPNIQETSGSKSPVRTFQDLLANPYDESLYEYYATSQLAMLSAEGGPAAHIGKPGIIADMESSPDAKHILVTRIHRPFSYLMPASDFPRTTEVVGLDGKQQILVAEVPLAENIPIEGVRTGPRNIVWKAGEPATLIWLEAQDGGDPKKKADFRDRAVSLAAPFTDAPRELFKLEQRARGVEFVDDPRYVIATDYDRDRRWTRTRMFDLKNPAAKPVVLDDRSSNDRYKDPGRLVTKTDEAGRAVVLREEGFVYRSGAGATPEGEVPFLRSQNLETLKTEELWRCAPGTYESVVDFIGRDGHGATTILTRHESPTSPPNYRMLTCAGATPTVVQITNDTDPQPQIRGIQKQLVKYKRPDGVDLSATLYLPADYKAGTRLPLVVWAYPLEFNDAATAGQVSGSPNRFTRISGISQLFFLTQGYAVMDNATMPIVGDPETMNDTFISQIVASAKGAIDKAVDMGVADRNRVGVGGHSYGAFMTANLLAHSDLFRAGCARSGAYNRTLTPFGFQSERRTLWEAPKIYNDLSPFMFADKINEPLLMIHGEADSNQGTFPIQSERLFAAIKGNKGTARLVLLPKESHGYSARESVLHVLAEMINWFDKYVKNAPVATDASGTK